MIHHPRLRLYTSLSSYTTLLKKSFLSENELIETQRLIGQSLGVKNAILTSMGRTAIFEVLDAIERKGEIIVSPVTVPEVISMIILAGFKPVFCDVKAGTWNIDLASAEKLITKKTIAIITTYFYGDMENAYETRHLCNKKGLIMIEDAAQALGAQLEGRCAGTIGDFGILSFSYPKNVPAFFGGCILTNNDHYADKIREKIKNYPQSKASWIYKKASECIFKDIGTLPLIFEASYIIIKIGYAFNIKFIKALVSQGLNSKLLTKMPTQYLSKMSPIQARLIRKKWPKILADVKHRVSCAKAYHEVLKDMDKIICPKFTDSFSHTYLYFPVLVDNKDELQKYLIMHGCDVGVQYSANVADLPAYKDFFKECPNARKSFKGTVMLPTYPGFPLDSAKKYGETVRNYCQNLK